MVELELEVPTRGVRDWQITEGRSMVWKSGHYVPGTSGLGSAKAETDSIVFQAGCHFAPNGAPL